MGSWLISFLIEDNDAEIAEQEQNIAQVNQQVVQNSQDNSQEEAAEINNTENNLTAPPEKEGSSSEEENNNALSSLPPVKASIEFMDGRFNIGFRSNITNELKAELSVLNLNRLKAGLSYSF